MTSDLRNKGAFYEKVISLILSLSLIFSLAACSQSENPDTGSEQPPTSNSMEVTDMQVRKLCFDKRWFISNGQPRFRSVAQCR